MITSEDQLPMLAEQVNLYLEKLGTTEDEAVQALTDMGITGYQRLANACVLAEYLRQHLPGVKLSVTTVSVHVTQLVPGFKIKETRVVEKLPAHLIGLVKHFDEGAYPQLVGKVPVE